MIKHFQFLKIQKARLTNFINLIRFVRLIGSGINKNNFEPSKSRPNKPKTLLLTGGALFPGQNMNHEKWTIHGYWIHGYFCPKCPNAIWT